MVSESYWILRWIAQNYDCLPKYLSFFHGRHTDWHRRGDAFTLAKNADPEYVRFYSQVNHAGFHGIKVKRILSNLNNDTRLGPSILAIAEALFGRQMNLSLLMDEEDMKTEGCCTESTINRDAVRYWPLRVYYSLLCLIHHYPVHTPWGWSVEHSWQMIFQSGIKRDMEYLGWEKGLWELVKGYKPERQGSGRVT